MEIGIRRKTKFFLKGGAQDTLSSKLLNNKRARFAHIKRVHESSKVLSQEVNVFFVNVYDGYNGLLCTFSAINGQCINSQKNQMIKIKFNHAIQFACYYTCGAE